MSPENEKSSFLAKEECTWQTTHPTTACTSGNRRTSSCGTDFNEDFSTIDAALGKTERSARASAYNVYNLMLQSDYEGKYTGYKRPCSLTALPTGRGSQS